MSRDRTHRGMVYTVRDAHPVADEYPWLSEEELQALADDVAFRGLREAIRMLPDGRILDGRNRELACLVAGVKPRYETARLAESEVRNFIESHNDRRRHETPEQRRERVQKLQGEGKSTRAIADAVGVSQATVRNDLKSGEQLCSPVPSERPEAPSTPPATVTGRDGKSYAATRPKPKDEPLKDERGRIVPAPLVPLFRLGRAFVNELRVAHRECFASVEAARGETWGNGLAALLPTVEADYKKIAQDVASAVPWCCCPHVDETGTHPLSGKCKVCVDGRGWLSRHNWHQLPDGVKKLIDDLAADKPAPDAAA